MQLDLVTHWSRHLRTLSYFKLTCDLLPEDILIHLPSDDTESSFPLRGFLSIHLQMRTPYYCYGRVIRARLVDRHVSWQYVEAQVEWSNCTEPQTGWKIRVLFSWIEQCKGFVTQSFPMISARRHDQPACRCWHWYPLYSILKMERAHDAGC